MIRFRPPASLQPLLDQLGELARASGVDAYVVGGTVRDVLLDRATRDVDLGVDRDAMGVARRIADALRGHFVELDDVNAVARVVLDEGAVRYVDIAQLQGTLEEDMRRRDFTIDALAAPIAGGAVIDVCGGLDDLAARVVRMNGDHVFDADPLRLLRGVRIAAELRFDIEPATETAIRERASRVNEAAAERRRDELARIFALDDAYGGLRLLDRTGLLDALLPEVAAGRGVTQPGAFHAYDVFEHALHAVEAMDVMLAPARPAGPAAWLWDELWRSLAWCEAELRAYLGEEISEGRTRAALLKLAALLHDVAKPQTRAEQPDGRVRFFGHADLGAEVAAARVAALPLLGEGGAIRVGAGRGAPAARTARAGRRSAHAAGAVSIPSGSGRRGASGAAAGACGRGGGARGEDDVRRVVKARRVYEQPSRAFQRGGGYSKPASTLDGT